MTCTRTHTPTKNLPFELRDCPSIVLIDIPSLVHYYYAHNYTIIHLYSRYITQLPPIQVANFNLMGTTIMEWLVKYQGILTGTYIIRETGINRWIYIKSESCQPSHRLMNKQTNKQTNRYSQSSARYH